MPIQIGLVPAPPFFQWTPHITISPTYRKGCIGAQIVENISLYSLSYVIRGIIFII
jgi:hypothetical protein